MAEVFSSNDASIEWNDDVGIQTLYRILSQAQTEIEKAFARVNVLNPNSGRTDADQKIRYAVRTIVQGLLEMFDAPHHSIVQPTIKTLFGRDLSKEKISRMAKGERDQFGNWIVVSAR